MLLGLVAPRLDRHFKSSADAGFADDAADERVPLRIGGEVGEHRPDPGWRGEDHHLARQGQARPARGLREAEQERDDDDDSEQDVVEPAKPVVNVQALVLLRHGGRTPLAPCGAALRAKGGERL